MRVLVGVPIYRVAPLAERCLDSLVDTPADILVIDNASDQSCQQVIQSFEDEIFLVRNSENRYCNPAWNQILEFGLAHDYDVIALGSSDVELDHGWYEALMARVTHKREVWLPAFTEPVAEEATEAENIAGAFTFLPREAAKLVYPIPEELKLWFGDEWMFTILRGLGWKTMVLNTMPAKHQQSAILSTNPKSYQIIEEDKLAWAELADALYQRIEEGDESSHHGRQRVHRV